MSKTWAKKALAAVGFILAIIAACLVLVCCVYLGAFIYENMNLGAFITFIVILVWSLLPSRLGSVRK